MSGLLNSTAYCYLEYATFSIWNSRHGQSLWCKQGKDIGASLNLNKDAICIVMQIVI
jgi:hypothetical protein